MYVFAITGFLFTLISAGAFVGVIYLFIKTDKESAAVLAFCLLASFAAFGLATLAMLSGGPR